jgi:hypothetical protein
MGSKAVIPMSKVLWHVKNPEKYERYILSAKFNVLSRQVSPDLLLVFARELWWMNQE